MAARYRQRGRLARYESETVEWSTPPDLFAKLDAEFHFTLDACATPENAKCAQFFTQADDGLQQTWSGRVWCNPPYGLPIPHWLAKARASVESGDAELVACLLPARTGVRWWHEHVMHGEVRFLPGRLRFGAAKNDARFASAIVVFRKA